MTGFRSGTGFQIIVCSLGLLAFARAEGDDGSAVDWALGQESSAIAPLYRKFATTGVLVNDRRVDKLAESDDEPEQTFIDGLTLRYRHQTTDFYVPQGDGDLALQVRRNYRSETWWEDDAIRPSVFPDRAFGSCWVSTLDARLAITSREGRAVAATVVDEDGTVHRFLIPDGASDFSVESMPTSEHQQETASIVLTKNGSRVAMRRKYGRVLEFFDVPSFSTGKDDEKVAYYRLATLTDPLGVRIQYQYDAGNSTLIPDQLVCRNQTLRIERNADGKVDHISDPIGNITRYEYAKISPEAGATLAAVWPAGSGPLGICTRYGYRETKIPEKDMEKGEEARPSRVLELASIADPNGSTYYFEFGGKRPAALSEGWQGLPEDRPLKRVVLPGNFGDARFQYVAGDKKQGGEVRVFARDAVGNGALLEFQQINALRMPKDVWPPLHLAVFEAFTFTFMDAITEPFSRPISGFFRAGEADFSPLQKIQYKLNPDASFALSQAIDSDGNVTRFGYQPAPQTGPWPGFARQDLASVTDALGERRTFSHDPASRLRTRTLEESGRVIRREIEAGSGRILADRIFAKEEDEKNDKPFSRIEYRYDDQRFPGFVTEKRIFKTRNDGPAWEKDLVTSYEADAQGRVWKQTEDPGGEDLVQEKTYDLSGDLVQVDDDDGIRRFLYDSRHHFLGTEWKNGDGGYDRGSEKLYDGRGNTTAELGNDRHAKFYQYDALNRAVKETTDRNDNDRFDPDVDETVTTYYGATGYPLRKADEDGPLFIKRYDGLGRIAYAYQRSDGTYRYFYGPNSGSSLFDGDTFHPTHVINAQNWIQRTYDPLQRLVCEVDSPGDWEGTIKRIDWDAAGNAVRETYANGRTIIRTYDAGDHLLEEKDSKGKEVKNSYTSTGLKYRTVTDGKVEEVTFDGAGHPLETPKTKAKN